MIEIEDKIKEIEKNIDNFVLDKKKVIKIKLLLLNDFNFFLQFIFYIIERRFFTIKQEIHLPIIKALEDITKQKNKERNLAIVMPVGSGKSTIMTYWVAWCFCRNINCSFYSTAHNEKLVSKRSKEIKDLFNNIYIKSIFELELDDKSKISWSFKNSSARAGFRAQSIGAGAQGYDAGMVSDYFSGALVIDDPMDNKTSMSPVERENVINIYSSLETRRRSEKTPSILIMQRTHEEDLINHIKTNLINRINDDWRIIEVKAFNEEKGESNWEEKWSSEWLLQHINNKHLNIFFQANYQQNPITLGAGIISRDWFSFYECDYLDLNLEYLFITTDFAFTEKTTSDYTVFCCWGVGSNNKLYLLDGLQKRINPENLMAEYTSFCNSWKEIFLNNRNTVYCRYVYFEDVSNNKYLKSRLSQHSQISIKEIKRKDNKTVRCSDILHDLSKNIIYLPKNNEFSKKLILECCNFSFGNTHKHDDIVDNVIDAIIFEYKNNFNTNFKDSDFYNLL